VNASNPKASRSSSSPAPALSPAEDPSRSAHVRSLEARVAELEEQLALERERATRRQSLQSLADELARLRSAHRQQERPPSRVPEAHSTERGLEGVLVDAPLDTRWAHPEPRMARCSHVFHQEWSGIRAAAGFAPGHKVAITADRPLTPAEHRRVIEACAANQSRTVIFQGFSSNMAELIPLMRRTLGGSVRLVAVWHGSTTQFHFPAEIEGFTQLLAMRRQGLLDGLACVKPEMYALSELVFPQTLLNLPPHVAEAGRLSSLSPKRAALLPLPNNWWKNFQTNLLVAGASARLSRVYVTAPHEAREELPLRAEVVNVGRLQRSELFRLIREVDVLLNVTLTECQPMSALEGLAFGVPCLTGALSLGELDAHPYQRLVQVAGTGALVEIQRALERVLELRERAPRELEQMLQDYIRTLNAEALRRYLEFTQP
jgi:hypothetical protein